MIRKYIFNTGWLFLEKILRIAVTLTAWGLVIRYLGPQQFGAFSYALSYVFLFGILVDLGMEFILVKDLVERPQDRPVILGSALLLRILGALAACAAIFFSLLTWSQDPVARALIIIMSLRLFFTAFNNIDSFFQSRVLSKYTVYAQLLSLAVTSVLCLVFVLLRKPLVYFGLIIVAESAVAAAGLVFFYRRHHKDRWNWDALRMRQILSRSWSLIIAGFAISIYMRLDQVMIKHMLGDEAVGQYAVAVRISEAFYFIPMAVTASLFPAIIQAKKQGESFYHERLKFLSCLLIWVSLGMVACFALFGRNLIIFLFGTAYLPAAEVLTLHMWAGVFVFMGVLRGKWAINEGIQEVTMLFTLGGAVVNVALNLIWIPAWGIQGAALATVAAQCFVAVLANVLHPKTTPIFFIQLQSLNPAYLVKGLWWAKGLPIHKNSL